MLLEQNGRILFSCETKLVTYEINFEEKQQLKHQTTELERIKLELHEHSKYMQKVDTYEYPSVITAMVCMKHKLVVGTNDGSLFFDRKHVVTFDAQISALFYSEPFLVLATSAGLIQIYKDKRICFKHWHRAPVNQIFFTNIIYLHDGSNRLVIMKPYLHLSILEQALPETSAQHKAADLHSRKNATEGSVEHEELFDNLKHPFKVFNNYIFIADDCFLYVKTANNFVSYLKLDNEVVDFAFSYNGGIMFLMEKHKIKIVDFNAKKVLREIRILSCTGGRLLFINNSLVYSNHQLNLIKDVLNFEEQEKKMKELILQEDYFYVRKSREEVVQSSDDEELKELFYSVESTKENRRNNDAADSVSSSKPDQKTPEDNSIVGPEEPKNISNDKICIPGKIQENNVILLCYNEIGFLMCKQDDLVNLIELIFHDRMISKKIIHCKIKCDRGCFDLHSVFLSTNKTIAYYEDAFKWQMDISTIDGCNDGKIKFLAIAKHLYVVIENSTHDSLVIMCRNGDVREIYDLPRTTAFIVKNEVILYVSESKLFICEEKSIKHVQLVGPVNFLTIDANKNIYYANNMYIYKVCHYMSKRLLKHANKLIICYYEGRFISLNKLLPTPDVEYLKVEEKKCNVEEPVSENNFQKQSVYDRFANVPKKTKKYNPLKDK